MKPWNKLHNQLATILFWILLSFVTALSFVVFRLGLRLYDEAISLAALPAIDALARELSMQSADSQPEAAQSISAKFQDLFPGIEFYLLDVDGNIVDSLGDVFADPLSVTRFEPRSIVDFLDRDDRSRMPAYCRTVGAEKSKNLFVASRVPLASGEYILLALLDGYVARAHVIYNLDEFIVPYVIFLVLGFILLSVGSNAAIQFGLTRRLRKLIEVVRKYTEGNFEQRIKLAGSDEVSLLGNYINQMAETIDTQVQALEAKDQRRRELIANVSHDLRGPVGILKLSTELLEQAPEIKQTRQLAERCTVITNSANSLGSLLHQLFELAKIEARDKPLEIVQFPLAELLEELGERYRERALVSGLTIKVTATTTHELVPCDPQMIERVICNLVENAIAYSNHGGSITLSVDDLAGSVKISVTDTGVGIAAEDLSQVFDRSFRAGNVTDKFSTSAGLGLAIVQRIIEAHGSEVKVTSEIGVGTTFWFVLPVE